jgi:DNA-binding MarR family transcriptional regulator
MSNPPPDHIGWTLWRAAQVWRGEFTAAMVAAGHEWFGHARGNLMAHIGPNGIRQGDLAARSGLTKQAVQQFVDELVADGVLLRIPDETDARARRVVRTPAGEAAMQDADRIKVEIEARWRNHLGVDSFTALDLALRRLIAPTYEPGQGAALRSGKRD